MLIEVKFEGGVADDHRIPAFEGTQSLEGIGRALTLISHYTVTAQVRYKFPFSDDFSIYLESFDSGSFKAKLRASYNNQSLVKATAILVGVAVVQGPIGNFTYDIMKHVWNQALGKVDVPETAELRKAIENKGGDLEALAQAITPPLKRAHTAIGEGVNSITIIGNGNNITTLDRRTKEYLETSNLDTEMHVKQLSVASFNVNSSYGRVYDFEFKHTLPFVLSKNVEPRSAGALGQSLSIYANKLDLNRFENAKINVRFQIYRDIDGNPLKYNIVDAWFGEE